MSISRYRSHRSVRQRPTGDQHRWIISYADFITLLFAFFVVMYSVSQVNVSKYRVFSDSLKETFSADHDKKPKGGETDSNKHQSSVDSESNQLDRRDNVIDGDLNIDRLNKELQKITQQLSIQDNIQVSGNEERIEINLNANILFEIGDAEPSYAAEVIFEEIANQLMDSSSSIDVEGYTDNQPIKTVRYPSNWQLASSRAASIVFLLQEFGIQPRRLSAIGYGEFRPVADNDTPEGRAKNRRVVLVLHRESIKRPVLHALELPKLDAEVPLSADDGGNR